MENSPMRPAWSLLRADGIGVLTASLEGGGWLERVTLHGEGLSVQVDAFRELRVLRGQQDQVSGREMAADWLTSQHIRGFEQLIAHFFDCVQQRLTPLHLGAGSIPHSTFIGANGGGGIVTCHPIGPDWGLATKNDFTITDRRMDMTSFSRTRSA